MTIYLNPDTTKSPFVPPVGATQNGGPVAPSNYVLFCSAAAATSLLPQYEQAAQAQGLTVVQPFAVVDGIKNGELGMFSPDAAGDSCYLIKGLVADAQGNVSLVNDIAGIRLFSYLNPFTPGLPTYGDTNYTAQQTPPYDVAVPGYLVLTRVAATCMQGNWVKAQ